MAANFAQNLLQNWTINFVGIVAAGIAEGPFTDTDFGQDKGHPSHHLGHIIAVDYINSFYYS